MSTKAERSRDLHFWIRVMLIAVFDVLGYEVLALLAAIPVMIGEVFHTLDNPKDL